MTERVRIQGDIGARRNFGTLKNVNADVDTIPSTIPNVGRLVEWSVNRWRAAPLFAANRVLRTGALGTQLQEVDISQKELLGVPLGGTTPTPITIQQNAQFLQFGAFPTLEDGLRVFRGDLDWHFIGDETAGGWWGLNSIMHVSAGGVESPGAGVFLQLPINVVARYTSSIGQAAPWDCKCVHAGGNVLASSTATVEVTSGSTGVTGAVLSWAAEVGDKDDSEMNSATITKSSTVGLRVQNNGGDSISVGYFMNFYLMRFET